jgi:hypothetical protein
MKIDDILLLARKNNPQKPKMNDDRIFIPNLNEKMMDSILRQTDKVSRVSGWLTIGTFEKKEILTLMDFQRNAKKKSHSPNTVEEDTDEKNQILKQNFEVSQHMMNILNEIERSKEVLYTIVIRKIEKELPQLKILDDIKDRRLYLEVIIKECIGKFDTLRKIFSNTRKDTYIEDVLMNLVTKESLEDIEKQMKNRKANKNVHNEATIKTYDLLRHDISNRTVMLDAYQVMEKLIEESKEKIIYHKMAKIECALRIRAYQSEVKERLDASQNPHDMGSPAHIPRSPMSPNKVMISGRPREFKNMLKQDLEIQKKPSSGMQVMMDMGTIHKARLNQLMEPFKTACDKIKHEQDNLDSLKHKKSKLRSKMIDVFAFLLKNPDYIL